MNEKDINIEGDWHLKVLYRQWFEFCRVSILFFSEGQTAEAVARLHSSLFHLLVMFSNEKSIMNVQVSEAVGCSWLSPPFMRVAVYERHAIACDVSFSTKKGVACFGVTRACSCMLAWQFLNYGRVLA